MDITIEMKIFGIPCESISDNIEDVPNQHTPEYIVSTAMMVLDALGPKKYIPNVRVSSGYSTRKA